MLSLSFANLCSQQTREYEKLFRFYFNQFDELKNFYEIIIVVFVDYNTSLEDYQRVFGNYPEFKGYKTF